MKEKLRTLAGVVGIALLMGVVTPTAASADNRYTEPIGTECSADGTSAIVTFNAEGETFWSVEQDGKSLTYGETDNARNDKYVIVVSIKPETLVSAYANGEVKDFTCTPVVDEQPSSSPIAEVIYEPTVSPVTLWEFYQNAWAKVLGQMMAL